ncbi:MAG: FTR1 family protein [Caldilinea sp.]|nr:FTR1 family protein [Caldilinea sp.]MDW8439899.1 FTR1 family protein [Caldilineaceae bacterium]
MMRILYKGLWRWLLVTGLVIAGALPASAQPVGIAERAETLRTHLLTAQLQPEQAMEKFSIAFQIYQGELEPTIAAKAPEIDIHILSAFHDARNALKDGDLVAYAAARAQIWTGLLHAAYRIVIEAVNVGDKTTARQWLSVREFRHATRFSHPRADATLAIARLGDKGMDATTAQRAVDADLLDAYQARLREALSALASADLQSHPVRRAELAGLAAGYFAILTPAFAEIKGDVATEQATALFEQLVVAASSGESVQSFISSIEKALENFQAAPLTPAEQARRAAQMVRFLALVPVEYRRGVRNGEVTIDLEIREAITFLEGAQAAFNDLSADLTALNADLTTQVRNDFAHLYAQLTAASVRQAVAEPDAIQQATDRLVAELRTLLPSAWQKQDSGADFDMIQASLDQMERAVAAGDYNAAASAHLDAYALLESGPEARLIAFAPQYITPLEELFWYGQGEHPGLAHLLERQASLQEIRATRRALDALLAEAQDALSGQSSPLAVALNASIIVFREGLEAVVILAALMASMVGQRRIYRRPMAWGVAAALVASALTWWLLQTVLAAFRGYGERLEALVSLVAIGVLLLITNWFFHRVYWTDWMADLHARKKSLLGGAVASQLLGFLTLGFSSVYREGFETVLFLQALVLEAGVWIVLQGVALGMIGVLSVGWLTFRLQSRLPYKRMLVVTGVLIGAVLLVMVGNTVHVMQLVGWMPLHPIRGVTLPYWSGLWFGLYPTWEGIGLQFAAAAFVIGSYFLAEAGRKRSVVKSDPRGPGSGAHHQANRPVSGNL